MFTTQTTSMSNLIRWGIVVVIVSLVVSLVLGYIIRLIKRWMRKRFNKSRKEKSESESITISIFSHLIDSKDLHFLDDDNAVANLAFIGEGGCGKVYKADIPNKNVPTIAIKRITLSQSDSVGLTGYKMSQILSEIKTVGQFHHRNIIPLLAHVSRLSCEYLVYEYMHNGSLRNAILEARDGMRRFDWPVRLNVAIDVAYGLQCLHTGITDRIVHRDLKPDNILLDNDMVAKITDFGLAELMPETKTHMSDLRSPGTLGYIAPECLEFMRFTTKCDIYSFGMLLGVLFTKMFPDDEFFERTNYMTMVDWMREVIKDQEKAPPLTFLEKGFERQMMDFLKLATLCTNKSPAKRPTVEECLSSLSSLTSCNSSSCSIGENL